MAVQPLADGMDGNLGRLLPGETEYARRDAAKRDGLQMMRGGSLQAGRVAGGELRFVRFRQFTAHDGTDSVQYVASGQMIALRDLGAAGRLLAALVPA